MDPAAFRQKVAASTAHRPVRDELSGMVFHDPKLFRELVTLALDVDDKNHHKACWTLELVCEKEIGWLKDYLDAFCDALAAYRHDGAIRSISKICLFCVQYNIRYREEFLTPAHLQKITEACFDWLIGNAKVASKAYAMRTLYLAGKSEAWIHTELHPILEQGFPQHSAAYKVPAREILEKLRRG